MLADALNQVEATINDRIAKLGAPAAGTPEAQQLAEDQRRLQAIAALRASWQDPTRASTISGVRDATATAGIQQVQDAFDQASGQVRSSAAARGLAGSSQARIAQGQAAATRDAGLTTAATAADDQATSIENADESSFYSALNQALQSTNAGTAGLDLAVRANRTGLETNSLLSENNDQYRAALSQAIGGFLTNGVGGAATAGFQRAQNINQQNANDYQEGLFSGQPTAKKSRVTWSLFD